MSMKFKTRQVDGVTVLDLNGRITLGEGSVTLRDAVRDVLSKGSNHILLNLANVDYIDSSGIGELVSAFTTVKNGGGELKLLHLTKKVHDLPQNTQLYTVFLHRLIHQSRAATPARGGSACVTHLCHPQGSTVALALYRTQ
jgi:anti-sigma B factor antagonist